MSRTVVAVFGSSQIQPGTLQYDEGVLLGRSLAEAGTTVATGGYAGAMEAVSRGAREAGGDVIGVTAPAVFPGRAGHNPWVTTEIQASTISERIHKLVDLAHGFVALPGSIGTATEVMVAWNDLIVAPMSHGHRKPLVVIGDVWASLVEHLATLVSADATGIIRAPTVADAVDSMVRSLRNGFPPSAEGII